MDERRVVDYFVIAGLPEETKPFDDFARDQHLKSTHNQAPITDITVIFPSLNEEIPKEYELVHRTPGGNLADLNHGSLRSPDVYLCYRRGFDKPPLVDIGVMFEGKESILPDSEVVETTHWNHCANINNSTSKTFLTFRRARPEMPCNSLVVTDIAVILANKESVPHAFCMINKNLNRGLVGSDVYICYKKSMNRTNHISYKPEILLRYPFEDRVNLPLPETVPMFCLPLGCSLERWPKTAQQSDPIFSTFVLTVSDAAEKLYGSAITFYESYPEEKLTEEQKKAIDSKPGLPVSEWTYNVNKCICILSRWPFFDTYERFLTFLYEMSVSPNPHPVSIERFVLHFLEEIPFPSSHGPGIFVELSPKEKLILTQPEEVPLPRSGAKFQKLLMNLGPDNCLLILVCALTEQKILVHSLRPDVLTAVAEALSMILFPFKWQCPYIPLCPLGLAEVLHAPLPFLIGVDSRFFDLYDPPPDVICIDLDTNNISLSDEKKKEKDLSIKLLPKKPGRVLRQTLETIYKHLEALMHQPLNNLDNTTIDKEFQLKRKEQKLELDIQVSFLQFMATILKGYKSYLLPITKAPTVGTTDTNSLFDLNGFLKSRNKDWHKFFNYLTKTQMFIRFIEERSFVSDMDAGLAFFDECADKVEEDENVHLLEMDDSHRSERTVIIMPPEPTGQLYTYQGFNLNPKLLDPNANNLGSKDKNTSRSSGTGIAPGSPMARRTKHEIKAAQRLARKCAMSPQLWARCLWSTCCSIWFIHLPSYVLSAQSAPTILQYAYDVMVKVHKCNLVPSDEICFRVMMQLCGAYHQPVVAVKLLFHMKRAGVQPNAITYGFYNRAVLEATWPSGMSNSGQLLWNKLRNVVLGAALFKKAGVSAEKRRLSTITDDGLSLLDPPANCGSHTSIDSAGSFNQKTVAEEPIEQPEENDSESSDSSVANSEGFAAFDKFRSRVGSIVRPSGLPLLNQSSTFKQPTFESSAGLLITGLGGPLKEEELDLSQLNVVTSPNGLVTSKRRYHRSGSCTEFNNPLRQPPPTSPPNPTINENSYKILTRSESFANDAGILAKLHTLKLDSLTLGSSRDSLKENPKVQQKMWSKSLFRRGSLNMRKLNVAPESCESSTENLGSTGSGAGSYEDIYNNMGTPKRSKFAKTKNKYRPERHSSTSNIVAEVDENTNRSPVKSPSRTPVTENDPLGALILGSEQDEEGEEEKKEVSRVPSEIELDETGAPLLFERRGGDYSVVRSATFTNEESDEEYEPGRPKSMHRSSTMPNSIDAPPPSFGSFKLPFARYSPSRFSLRKAADRINTQMIENITSLSPNLTSKKSNELIMGGLSSLKSAATSVAKKIDEIKGAISANTTPVKSASHRSTLERDACLMEDEEYGEEYSVRRKISMEYSPVNRASGNDNWGANLADWFMDGSRKGSSTNLGTDTTFDGNFFASQQCILFPKFQRDPSIPIALQIIMTTCSKCHNCSSVLYDEEIMAGWIPEDSNLNTKCQFCDKATVPLLSVSVIDYRNSPMVVKERKISTISLEASRTSLISDSVNGEDDVQPKTCEPITVPYLNPLVLRKEFESILTAEGDSALTQPKFVDEHPIIYWNMVWTFTRINMDSHFPGLALGSNSTLSDPHPSWENAGSANVLISTVWHNSRLNDEVGPPMYLSWNMNNEHSPLVSALVTDQARVSTKEFQNVLQKTISCLQCSDLVEPLKFLAVERKKLKGRGHSLYREILFLGITALGRDNIDQGAFDKEYQTAYEKIMERNPDLYIKCDQPISAAATFCRQYFRPLEL